MNIYEEIFFNNIRLNIKYYRLKKGYTQNNLAELCYISYDYMNEIENLKRNKTFSLSVLFRISQVLDINIKELFE